MAAFAGFPAAAMAWYVRLRSGLKRAAERAGMYSASRRGLRPPLDNGAAGSFS